MSVEISPLRDSVILLVEDDLGDQELTRRALGDEKIRTELHVVNNGEEALAYLYRQGPYADPAASPRPDLILLDLNMPKLDGLQTLLKLRDDSRFNTLPIVILTTSQREEDIARSYQLGCNSYISKPAEIGCFIQAIGRLGTYWFKHVALPRKAA